MVEILKKYKSKDGNLYDTYKEAEDADKALEPVYDVKAVVALYEKSWVKEVKRNKWTFPETFTFTSKYGTEIFQCTSTVGLERMGLYLLRFYKDYYAVDKNDEALVEEILDGQLGHVAYMFVTERGSSDYTLLENINCVVFD